KDGLDGNFEDVNLDSAKAELEVILPTFRGTGGDDVIDTSKVVASVDGETGAYKGDGKTGAWTINYENGREGVYIDKVVIQLKDGTRSEEHTSELQSRFDL